MPIYLVTWTGGYELPQFAIQATEAEAIALARSWDADVKDEDGDMVLVYRIDQPSLALSPVEWE